MRKEADAGKQNFQVMKGSSVSVPRKTERQELLVLRNGVYAESIRKGIFGTTSREADYNHFRQTGSKMFKPGTTDRAVSLSTVSAYDELRRFLPDANVQDGDLGENFILDGPHFSAGTGGLSVGTVLRIGEVEIELMEANKPCYRLSRVPWAAHAAASWVGEKWWNHRDCPMSQAGGRGWLAKVLVEGRVHKGDQCTVVQP